MADKVTSLNINFKETRYMFSKAYLARELYVRARAQQDLSAGDGDSLSNTILRRLNHSIQSSFDSFLPAPSDCNRD